MFSNLLYTKRCCKVTYTKFAEKQASRIPKHIAAALLNWVEAVERKGIWEIRKIPGFHDEPLKGNRTGQRSVRLSRGFRIIYEQINNLEVTIILVQEVNKHDY